MGISMIEKIYNSLMDDEAYGDLPETEEARKKLKTYVMNNLLSSDDEESYRQWMELERTVSEFGIVNEQQGFIFGFNYAVELLTKGRKQCISGKLDENIKSEYSTLAVGKINKMDKVEDILKEYVPEGKLSNAIDTFCSCLDETKYAVFEQGFLRGIAAMKGGNI
ncbi:MAG: hypothetical protein HDR20_07970 [Lachnospiraceae bacterium]|nr:hypothetical protein [Lachnospiraceae bacterium]